MTPDGLNVNIPQGRCVLPRCVPRLAPGRLGPKNNARRARGNMDALFWIGQVVWLCILACGAYVSFCFADLADAESAKTVTPDRLPQECPPARRGAAASFIADWGIE